MKIPTDPPLDFINNLLQEKTNHSLDNTQMFIFITLWKNNSVKYQAISEEMGCSIDKTKTKAAELWKLLGEATGEKISKANFQSKLIQYIRENTASTTPANIMAVSPNYNPENSNKISQISQTKSIESPESVVPLNSQFYLQRKEELYAYSEISQPGALIRIKGKRHSGKTSFMSRLIASANSLGYKTITINFHTVETQNFESIKIFWKWFCRYLAREIELPDRLSEYWDDDDGPNTNCFFYLEKYLLVQESRSLLLAFDRIDHIINYPQVANEFFACLRSWHDSRAKPLWDRLHYIIVESEEKIQMKNTQSPFNVGLEVELVNFSVLEIIELAKRHNLSWDESQVQQLITIFGDNTGHPRLIRRILYYLVRNNLNLEQFLDLDLSQIEKIQEYLPA